MSAATYLQEAAYRTAAGYPHDRPVMEAFSQHLGGIIDRDGPPPTDGLASAFLNYGLAPDKERAQAIWDGLNKTRDSVLTHLGSLGVFEFDPDKVSERSEGLSSEIIAGVAETAAQYPDTAAAKKLKEPLAAVLGGSGSPDAEDRAVSATVLLDFVMPHVTRRLVEFDWRDPEASQRQIRRMASDTERLASFCGSLKPTIEALVTPDSVTSGADAAERLFAAGPLVVKMGQGLPVIAESMGNNARFFDELGGALQEGVAPPSEEQEVQLAGFLPEGLDYEGVISSASIAHVLRTRGPSGERLATKVARPGISEAITGNVEAFEVVIGALSDYIERHAGDTELCERLNNLRAFVPFGLRILESDVRQELDLSSEQAVQTRASQAFSGLPGVRIPQVQTEYSDAKHLTMEFIEGEKVAQLPANPTRLRNLLAFGIQSWRSKLLHGDLHGGNLKSTEDGSVVVYDWARPVDLSPRFVMDMARFVFAVKRRNPRSIAKAYHRIQSPDHNQCTVDEAEQVAQDVIKSLDDQQAPKGLGKSKVIQNLIIAMGVRKQSTLDTQYASFLKTSVAFGSVLKAEIDKPHYRDRKAAEFLPAFLGALKDVYITGRLKNKNREVVKGTDVE